MGRSQGAERSAHVSVEKIAARLGSAARLLQARIGGGRFPRNGPARPPQTLASTMAMANDLDRADVDGDGLPDLMLVRERVLLSVRQVPRSCSLFGVQLTAQAVSLDAAFTLALTNALDITLGTF